MVNPSGSGPADQSPAPSTDLASRAAAQVETLVELVRDKSTLPLLKAAEAVVFSFVILALLAVAGILFAAAVLRILDDLVFHQRVWASYTVIGGVFTLAGMFLLSRRHPRPEKSAS